MRASKNDGEHGCNFMLYMMSCKNIGSRAWEPVAVYRIVRMGTVEVMAFGYAVRVPWRWEQEGRCRRSHAY